MSRNNPQNEILMLNGVRLRTGSHIAARVIDGIRSGEYEATELRSVAACLTPDDVVMELGSGLGFLAIFCAKKVGGHRVFTYEANPLLEPAIRANFLENNVFPQLSMCVLGAGDGEVPFYLREEFWASSLSQESAYLRKISVPLRNVNAEIQRVRPTFLIVDIEGGEYDLFRQVDLAGVSTIVIELHRPETADADEELLCCLFAAGLRPVAELCGHGTVVLRRCSQSSSVEDVLATLPWRLSSFFVRRLATLVPPGGEFILVDSENLLSETDFEGRHRRFLIERDGVEWGLPADDTDAIGELEAGRARGARWIVFLRSSFWFLEAFPGLHR